MLIRFGNSEEAWRDHPKRVLDFAQEEGISICDVGGGANPLVPIEVIREKNIRYTVLDISEEELSKAPEGYHKLLGDITSKDWSPPELFDVVITRSVAEHVEDGRLFHENIFKSLKPGGRAFHFFPTLYGLPFVTNKILPEPVSEWILHKLSPGREKEGNKGKFVAHYNWCRGPTKTQIARLQSIGYEIVEYTGFFGHLGYYRRLPGLKQLHILTTKFWLALKWPYMTSFAYLVLRRPE